MRLAFSNTGLVARLFELRPEERGSDVLGPGVRGLATAVGRVATCPGRTEASLPHSPRAISRLWPLVLLAVAGCYAVPPPNSPLVECLADCVRVGERCNPGREQGRFSIDGCVDLCLEPDSRLLRYPDCVPCLAERAECTGTVFIDRCLDVCWDTSEGDGLVGM